MMNPIFSYTYLFACVCICSLLFTAYRGIKDNINTNMSIRISFTDIYAAVLFFFIGVNTYLHSTINDQVSNYFSLFSAISIYTLTRCFIVEEKVMKWFITAIIVLSLSEVIIGIGQVVEGRTIIGSFGGRVAYANFLAVTFPFVLNSAITAKRKNGFILPKIIFYCSALSIVTIVTMFTYSRTAFFSVFITIALMIGGIYKLKYVNEKRLNLKIAKLFVMGSIFICLSVLFILKRDSNSGRWFIIKRQLDLISLHPLTGIGFGNFDKAYNDQQALYFSSHTDPKSEYLASYVSVNYNEYLDFVLKGGLIGVLVMGLILARCWNLIIKSSPEYHSYAFCCLAVFVIAMFSYPSENMAVGCIFIFSIAILASSDRSRFASFVIKNKYLFLPVVVINLFLTGGMMLRYNDMVKWHIMSTSFHRERVAPKELVKQYHTIFPELNNDPDVLTDYARKLMICRDYKSAIKNLNRAALYSSKHTIYTSLGECYEELGDFYKAKLAFTYASHLVPNHFYPQYKLMMVYKKLGQSADSYSCAVKILHMPVKVQSPVVDDIIRAALQRKVELQESQPL